MKLPFQQQAVEVLLWPRMQMASMQVHLLGAHIGAKICTFSTLHCTSSSSRRPRRGATTPLSVIWRSGAGASPTGWPRRMSVSPESASYMINCRLPCTLHDLALVALVTIMHSPLAHLYNSLVQRRRFNHGRICSISYAAVEKYSPDNGSRPETASRMNVRA